MGVFPLFSGTLRDEHGQRGTGSLGLITRRSQVQVLPPLLRTALLGGFRFLWVPYGCHTSVRRRARSVMAPAGPDVLYGRPVGG